VNLMLFTLGQVLDDAMRQGLVTRNVVALVDRLAQSKTGVETYTRAEVRKVLAAARDDRLEHAWHLALSGMRRGEVCGLRWADLDLTGQSLSIVDNRVTVDGAAMTSEPKTAAGKRTLPLTDPLIRVLRRAKRRHAAEQLAAGALYVDTGYLVVDEVGGRLHPDTVSDRWNQLVVAAGVRRIRLHDARHTCGTLMHLEGVPTAVIAAWLEHASPAFTMRTYVHSQHDALRHAADVLGSVTRA
jgi:integrase